MSEKAIEAAALKLRESMGQLLTKEECQYAAQIVADALATPPAPPAPAPEGWREIASAPKNDGPDDEKIDLYGDRCGRCTDCYWCESVWISVGADGTECEVNPADVTHWMPRPKRPLPAPPSIVAEPKTRTE